MKAKIVIYEMSASFARMCRIRLLVSKFVQYFLKRTTLCLICRIPFMNRTTLVHAIAKVSIELIAIYFHSFEIFIIQIGEMAFSTPQFIVIKSNYFQNAQKALALVLERRFCALVLRNGLGRHSSARTSISRTTVRSRNVILKVVSLKISFVTF
jgi:hypothetical protein